MHQIEAELNANPPKLAYQPERVEIFKRLDAWALAPDTVYHFFSMVVWPRGLHDHLTREFDPLIIPAHEHEVGHKPRHGVSLLANHYRGLGQLRLKRGKGTVLAWGEKLALSAPPRR